MRDLAELQNLVKRDKESYHQEFLLQFRHYLSELEIFKFNPAVHSSSFCDLVNFLSQVASCYPTDLAQFPQQLTDLLEQHSTVLHADTRISLVKSLILIRNRDLIPATTLLPLFFKLFRVHDKTLRNLLKSHIISDIKRMNQKKKNSRLNKTLQNFMRVMLKDTSEIAAKHSLDVMIELYRKKIWDDPHTVNVIAEGCFSKVTKILVGALQFFLSNNIDPEEAKASNDEDKELANKQLQKLLNSKSQKSRKKTKNLKKARDRVTKVRSRDAYLYVNFPAIQVLNDPQGLAEKIFGTLKHSSERFEVRIMMMNFISRMISVHKLLLINFYPWIKRYIQPSQQHVTHILAIVAQASHDIIDYDTMQPVIKAISDNFVSDRCSGAAITVGLNCVREICMRCPFALDEDSLLYFIQYKTFKDKGVRMAAKSLISLFRVINPKLLPKKERGKDSQSVIPRLYGQEKVADMVDGTDMLEEEYFGSEYLDENGNYQYLDDNGNQIDFDQIDKEKNENGEEEGEDDEVEEGDENEEVDNDNDNENEIGDEEEVIEGENEEGDEEEESDDKRSESMNSKSSMASTTSSTRSRTSRLDAIRLFTDEDFEKIDALKIQREADKFSGKKRHRKEAPINTEDVSEQVDSSNIESFIKKRKMNYDERMQTVMEGREGREKFGSKRGNREASSTSNSVKNKGKPFQLTKYSREVREKNLRSAKEKMAIRRQHSLSSKSGKKK